MQHAARWLLALALLVWAGGNARGQLFDPSATIADFTNVRLSPPGDPRGGAMLADVAFQKVKHGIFVELLRGQLLLLSDHNGVDDALVPQCLQQANRAPDGIIHLRGEDAEAVQVLAGLRERRIRSNAPTMRHTLTPGQVYPSDRSAPTTRESIASYEALTGLMERYSNARAAAGIRAGRGRRPGAPGFEARAFLAGLNEADLVAMAHMLDAEPPGEPVELRVPTGKLFRDGLFRLEFRGERSGPTGAEIYGGVRRYEAESGLRLAPGTQRQVGLGFLLTLPTANISRMRADTAGEWTSGLAGLTLDGQYNSSDDASGSNYLKAKLDYQAAGPWRGRPTVLTLSAGAETNSEMGRIRPRVDVSATTELDPDHAHLSLFGLWATRDEGQTDYMARVGGELKAVYEIPALSSALVLDITGRGFWDRQADWCHFVSATVRLPQDGGWHVLLTYKDGKEEAESADVSSEVTVATQHSF